MSFLTHINRYDGFNYNEDFEESIAKNTDSLDEDDEEGLFCFRTLQLALSSF